LTAPIGSPRQSASSARRARGMLVETADVSDDHTFDVVSERQPTAKELADLRAAWIVCKHVKSNAVAFVKDGVLIGMVPASRTASAARDLQGAGRRAGEGLGRRHGRADPVPRHGRGLRERGCTWSPHRRLDPRRDSVEAANKAGITLIVTGVRHFRH